MGSLGKPAQAGARIPSQPPAGAGPRLCSALPRHRGSNLRVSWSRYSGSGGQSSPRASLASKPRCWGSLAGFVCVEVHASVQRTHGATSRVECKSLLVTWLGECVRAMPLRPGHGVLSAAGPCRCTELIHAVRGRGSLFARHNPVASGVEFASRLVTLRGGYAGTPWATGCAHGRRRQPAHAGAGVSFMPPACGGPSMSAAFLCHQGSVLRTPWSRYSCIGYRAPGA